MKSPNGPSWPIEFTDGTTALALETTSAGRTGPAASPLLFVRPTVTGVRFEFPDDDTRAELVDGELFGESFLAALAFDAPPPAPGEPADPVVSAAATDAIDITAAPIPNPTANAPIRPTKRPFPAAYAAGVSMRPEQSVTYGRRLELRGRDFRRSTCCEGVTARMPVTSLNQRKTPTSALY
ncbi:hypothetical protein [Mycobacterium sp. DL592]|uniref:hypothetical protein n=1 Tax=Mycobacterium sp. DL592 TaxID=2675524 RepID=UPI0014202A28|nr:hypothetical protein [Mycobacterium sp. DL592]